MDDDIRPPAGLFSHTIKLRGGKKHEITYVRRASNSDSRQQIIDAVRAAQEQLQAGKLGPRSHQLVAETIADIQANRYPNFPAWILQ